MTRKQLYWIFGITEVLFLASCLAAWFTFVYGIAGIGVMIVLVLIHLVTIIPFGFALRWWKHVEQPSPPKRNWKTAARVVLGLYLTVNWVVILFHGYQAFQPHHWNFG